MKKILLALLVLAAAVSCEEIGRLRSSVGEFFGDEAVARVGKEKLYRSTLEGYIPDGLAPEDSAAMASQFIKSWATDRLFLEVAEAELSKSEMDVSKELEEYRISLLKYRFEQHYINERLDTNITPAEIRHYYEENLDKFILDAPLLKVRYMLIPKGSAAKEKIKKKMSSDNVEEIIEADSMAVSAAIRYVDCTDRWTDLQTLSLESGSDPATLLSSMKKSFIEVPVGQDNVFVAYVADMVKKGSPAPIEYSAEKIKDIILSARKRELVSSLERDLLKDAQIKEIFEIL